MNLHGLLASLEACVDAGPQRMGNGGETVVVLPLEPPMVRARMRGAALSAQGCAVRAACSACAVRVRLLLCLPF